MDWMWSGQGSAVKQSRLFSSYVNGSPNFRCRGTQTLRLPGRLHGKKMEDKERAELIKLYRQRADKEQDLFTGEDEMNNKHPIYRVSDHAEISIVDFANSIKKHVFKKVDNKVYYQQHINGANFYPHLSNDGWGHPIKLDNFGYAWAYHAAVKKIVWNSRGHRTWLSIDRNQAHRDACVMAVDYQLGKCLVSYQMPAGRIFMNILSFDRDAAEASEWGNYYAVSKKQLSKKWRRLVRQENTQEHLELIGESDYELVSNTNL